MKRKYTITGKYCKINPLPNLRKVNNIDPEKYKAEGVRFEFKNYKPGISLEDQPQDTEPVTCSFFECRKLLSLRQQLAGNRCEDHPKEVKTYFNSLL